jgi:hypothetical protein
MTTQAVVAEIELGPGWSANLEPTDADSAQALAKLFGDLEPRHLSIVVKADSADVSGHAMDVTVDVTIADPDDVEGQSFTLHFPNADAAQRLRLKLAAGVIIAATLTLGGAAVATEFTAQPHVGAPDVVVPAAPAAPFISRGLQADIISGDIIAEEAAPAPPFVSRGLQADIRSGDIVQEEALPPVDRHPGK